MAGGRASAENLVVPVRLHAMPVTKKEGCEVGGGGGRDLLDSSFIYTRSPSVYAHKWTDERRRGPFMGESADLAATWLQFSHPRRDFPRSASYEETQLATADVMYTANMYTSYKFNFF
jgi:hypothetical protein